MATRYSWHRLRASLVLLFGPILLVLSLLVALVGSGGACASAHTVAQAVVATVLAIAIIVGTFWVSSVPVAFSH